MKLMRWDEPDIFDREFARSTLYNNTRHYLASVHLVVKLSTRKLTTDPIKMKIKAGKTEPLTSGVVV